MTEEEADIEESLYGATDFVLPDDEPEATFAYPNDGSSRREPVFGDLCDIIRNSRTWESRANRYEVLRWMHSPKITQRALAKRLRISERRVQQIVRELKRSISRRK